MAEPVQVEVDDNESVTEDSKGDKSNDKDTVLHNIEEEITGMMNIKYLLCITKPNICFDSQFLCTYHCYVTTQSQL